MPSSPLISVAELATARGAVTILDVRYKLGGPPGAAEFALGHVPEVRCTSISTPRWRHHRAAVGGIRCRMRRRSARAMQRAGVSASRPVVVYDDWGARAAGRAWWLLRYFGHGDVRVLDGGWAAWKAAGQAIATGEVAVVLAGTFAARPGGMPIVDAADVPGRSAC